MAIDCRSMMYEETRTTKERNEDEIKALEHALEHEHKKRECILKLEELGFDIEILKEVLR